MSKMTHKMCVSLKNFTSPSQNKTNDNGIISYGFSNDANLLRNIRPSIAQEGPEHISVNGARLLGDSFECPANRTDEFKEKEKCLMAVNGKMKWTFDHDFLFSAARIPHAVSFETLWAILNSF